MNKDISAIDLSPDKLADMLYQMYLVRAFEDAAFQQYAAGHVHGTMHLYSGEEAVAIGAIAALRPDDLITSTHRGHGHAIAKGQNVREMMAELLGKETGVCLGRGGSMHMADLSLGSLGANGVVSGGIPLSVGAGLSVQLQQQDKVVISFFGDGATNGANFHESLNTAAVWKLPVIFICENNQYAMSMSMARSMPVARVANRAPAYNMPGETIDGMDTVAVYQAVRQAVERTRQGGGPMLLEMLTYRYKGHSKSDKQVYRSKEEVKDWMAKDPIPRFQNWLIEQGHLTEAEGQAIEEKANAAIEDAIKFAHVQPDPSPANLLDYVYFEEPEVKANPNNILPTWIKETFGPNTPINPPPGQREISYSEALREAMALALEHDPQAFLLGDAVYGFCDPGYGASGAARG